MEVPSWVVSTTAWITALALLLKAFHFYRRQLNLPPGPKPWPIIGNLNLIGPLPHHSIYQLSQKYGPIMQLRFGSFPVVVGSSAEMAKQFFTTHDLILASRPKTAAGKYTTHNYMDITWAPYGPHWRQGRKLYLTELFSPKRLKSYEYIRVEEMKASISDLYALSGKAVTIKDHVSILGLNIISRMVLGRKYVEESISETSIVTQKEFKEMLDELFLLNGVMNIGDWIPWIDFLDLHGYLKRMKAVSKKFNRFLDHVIDEHDARRRGVKDFIAKDMVDVLLQLDNDPNAMVKLTRTGVKGLIQDLVAGGTDTSAATVEWTMSELMKQPEIIHKAIEELDRVIGKERWVEEKDIQHLPYLEAIVKESMRLHPVAVMLAPHLAREDCKIDGYDVPAGTQVFVNVWAIGRDPKLWDKPLEFCPDRFMGRDIDVKGLNFELLPFGSGRRMCPGYRLGLKVIQLSLANLLHGFTWKLPDGMKPGDLDMEEVFGLATPRKNPLIAIVQPRLPVQICFQ